MDNTETLVKMANNIGSYFQSEPDPKVAVDGITNHLASFWEKRMRIAIVQLNLAGGRGLSDLVKKAVDQLAERQPDLLKPHH
jgi:formate dehydrogenase subunit delta